MENLATMPLKKTYQYLTPLSIMITPSLKNPQKPSIWGPSSSPSTSKANGITVSGKLLPLILSLISSTKTPTTLAGLLLMDFFLEEGRLIVETVDMFPMKQPMKETTLGAKLSELPKNKWHTWEHQNASNTPPSTSTG